MEMIAWAKRQADTDGEEQPHIDDYTMWKHHLVLIWQHEMYATSTFFDVAVRSSLKRAAINLTSACCPIQRAANGLKIARLPKLLAGDRCCVFCLGFAFSASYGP